MTQSPAQREIDAASSLEVGRALIPRQRYCGVKDLFEVFPMRVGHLSLVSHLPFQNMTAHVSGNCFSESNFLALRANCGIGRKSTSSNR